MNDQQNSISSIEPIRLQKWCSQLGIGSRRQCEAWITEGRVTINGRTADLGAKIVPGKDHVSLDGRPLRPRERAPFVYWMLNKPRGYLCSTRGEEGKETIYQLPALRDVPFQVHPVGRLDFMSEGLLILTNDGEFQHRLSHPSFKMPRHYQVLSHKKLEPSQIEQLAKGVKLSDGEVTAEVSFANSMNLGQSRGFWYFVTISQGKKRVIRRMFEAMNCRVLRLRRYGLGDLRIGDLKEGQLTQLPPKDIRYLKKNLGF